MCCWTGPWTSTLEPGCLHCLFAEDGILYASEAKCTGVDMPTYRLSYVYIHVVVPSHFKTSPMCSSCCNMVNRNCDIFHFKVSYFSESPIISEGKKCIKPWQKKLSQLMCHWGGHRSHALAYDPQPVETRNTP